GSRQRRKRRMGRGGEGRDGEGRHAGDRGERAAQVVRGTRRARRHRPERRGGEDLRAARPQRRRQDHRGEHTFHAHHSRRRRGERRRPRRVPGAGRRPRRDRRHRAILGGGRPPHRRGEPDPDGRPRASWQIREPAARGRAAGALRSCRRGQEEARHLLRRYATPARPRDDVDGRSPHRFPRRANNRPGSPQPPHHVADHPRSGSRRRNDLPYYTVPGGGGQARRPDRHPRPWQDRRGGDRGRAQAPHPRGAHQPPVRRRARPRIGRPGRGRGLARRRGARATDPDRRRRGIFESPARPARGRGDRGRQAVHAHPRPRRCLPRPDRRPRHRKGGVTM
ncbi:MAG: Efflux ABC transporter, ATP-binding protein, partial [uncultured Thermomicrobiales bacterium]